MGNISENIWVYDPVSDSYKKEEPPAEKIMRIIYGGRGESLVLSLIKRKALSRAYGVFCASPFSKNIIAKFGGDPSHYSCFADFFTRKKEVFFPKNERLFASPAEGCAFIYKINSDSVQTVKGSVYSVRELLGDYREAKKYENGFALSVRLKPDNYHRLHFFDDGIITERKKIDGVLYSVSPMALESIARLYCANKREVLKFSSVNFGDCALVLVGATFVGSIAHTHKIGDLSRRGDCMSYFLPGGSLIICFFKKNILKFSDALIRESNLGYEYATEIGGVLGEIK